MTIYSIIIFLVMLCLLIFVHELGHFLVARLCGVKVNEFALGMGPTFFRRQKGETTYSLRAIPIGGFCSMEGEDEESEDPRAFNKKPAWKRAAVLFAGPVMNLFLCILLLVILSLYTGVLTTSVDQVNPGSPAEKAGIQPGDQIVAVDHHATQKWDQIIQAIGEAKKQVTIEVQRDGRHVTLTSDIMKVKDEATKKERKVIGILPVRTHNPATAVVDGVKTTWDITKEMGAVLKGIVTGNFPDIVGPVGMGFAVDDAVKQGFLYLLFLTALISLNLGIVNLLPLPALDGGRLIFLVIRKITGKAITDKMEGAIHFAGIIVLLGLMVFVTWHDIVRFILPSGN